MAGFLDNFQDHRRLWESWNKLLEEGHWKGFTILVSAFIEVSRKKLVFSFQKDNKKHSIKSTVLFWFMDIQKNIQLDKFVPLYGTF